MNSELLVFTSSNVLLCGSDNLKPATLEVHRSSGKISALRDGRASRADYPYLPDDAWFDVGDNWILPGLVDAHVHLNEPGRTEWEGFWTGTRAAASGGVTTVVDMPLNSIPPTTTVENFDIKRKAAESQCWTDVAFWGGVIPGNEKDLMPLVEAGVKGFKCFLIESGVDEFPCVQENHVAMAMSVLKDTASVLAFHAELDTDPSTSTAQDSDPTLYTTFLNSRPQKLETDAIALIVGLQQQHPSLRCHIVHLSAASALPAIRAAKAAGAKLTVETCFHYLALAADAIPPGRPEFKCCPPVRDAANRELLWAALRDGTIDCVVSDHSPCVAALKRLDAGDVMGAWGGISTLGLGLSVLWTEARKRGIGIRKIMEWTSGNTAKHASLQHRKGAIRVGLDADLAIWDPDAQYEVTKDLLNYKNKLSPYEGMALYGRVEKTFVRGRLSWDRENGGFTGLQASGCLV